jgi:hypothetical protein
LQQFRFGSMTSVPAGGRSWMPSGRNGLGMVDPAMTARLIMIEPL